MQKNHTILITLVALLWTGCTSPNNVDHICRQAEELMTERPDSAYTLLTTVRNGDVSPERLQARHALLLAQATDKCYVDSDNDSLTLTAYNYFVRRGITMNRALAAYYHGRVLQNGGSKEEATRFFLEAKDDAEQLDDKYLLGLTSLQLGQLYCDRYLYEQALTYFQNSYDAYMAIGMEEHAYKSLSYIALTYGEMNDIESAIITYDKCFAYAQKTNNKQYENKIYYNIAFQYYSQGKISTAYEMLIDRIKCFDGDVNEEKVFLLLAEICLTTGNLLDANGYLQIIKDSDDSYIKTTVLYYLYQIAKAQHQYKLEAEYCEQYLAANELLTTDNLRNDILSVERRYDKQKVEFDNYRLSAKHRVDVLLIAVCGLLILLLALLFSVYARRKRARIEEYCLVIQNLETSHETLIQTLDDKSVTESRLKELLDRRFDFIRKVAAEAYVHFDGNKSKMAQTINDMLKIDSTNNELFADLYDVVNLRYNGALDRLVECYKDKLSRRDVELCALLGIGFGVNEICALYQGTLTPEAVYRRRSRLKAKFGVTDHFDMCELLNKWSHSSEQYDETLTNQTNTK